MADGVQAVSDIRDASHPERRMFGSLQLITAGGIGFHQELALHCTVPTIIHHLSFEPFAGVLPANIEIINAADAPAGAPVTVLMQGWHTRQNILTTRNTSPTVLAGGFQLTPNPLTQTYAPGVNVLTEFRLAGGRHITIQDTATNGITFFRIIWEEQAANRTNPDFS